MPAPDPTGIYYDETPDGRWTVQMEIWASSGWFPGNPRHRRARAAAVARKVRFDGWRCDWCNDFMPFSKRADARYCCEGCRKRAARARRAQ